MLDVRRASTHCVHYMMDILVFDILCAHCVRHLIGYLAVDRAHPIPSCVHLHHLYEYCDVRMELYETYIDL